MCPTVSKVAKRYFLSAIKEEKAETAKEKNTDDEDELTERSFSTLFSVTSLIDFFTDKLLEIFVKSSYCHECKIWESKLNSAEYEEWHELQVDAGNCQPNHIDVAGNMEAAIISKTYPGLVNSKPYGYDFPIVKKEGVGHIQKRLLYSSACNSQ